MSLPVSVTRTVEALLLPPGGPILLLVVGLLLLYVGRGSAGRLLVAFGLVALWVLSLPVVADALLRSLETGVRPVAAHQHADAIVVLAGGRHGRSPEFGGETVGPFTLERLRYAAQLHRQTGLPVLASGGSPNGEETPIAELMRRALVVDFRVDPVWTEERSATTRENALFTASALRERGVRRILLVTHAWHMPRSREVFEKAGLEVVPAPTLFTPAETVGGARAWLPDAHAMARSRWALHEWLGRVYYRLLE